VTFVLSPYEAEIFHNPEAGQVQVDFEAIFAELPNMRVSQTAKTWGKELELNVCAVPDCQLIA